MRLRFGLTLAAFALTAAGLQPLTCAAQIRLSYEQGGLGLRQQTPGAAESPLAPRQHTLGGDVRTAVGDSQALSVGIRYRVYDAGPSLPVDAAPANGYGLVPFRSPASGYAPGYRVQFGYQYSAFTLFGFAVSRELETYATAFDPASPYPLQISLTGQHWLSPSWALSYDVLSGDLGSPNPLRLQGLGLRLGVRYRF